MLLGTATVLALVMVSAACSDSSGAASDDAESVATTTIAAPTATTTTAPVETTEESDTAPQPLPSVGTLRPFQLTPGEYTTTVMTPTVTITIGEGWMHIGEFEPLLLMSREVSGGRQQDFLNFVTFPENSVDAVADAIQSEPGTEQEVSNAQPAAIGGAEGRSFVVDVTVPGGGSAESFAFPNDRLYSQVPLDPPRFSDGDRVRFTVVQVGEDVLAVMAGVDAELDFDAFLEDADEVLATVGFDESPAS